MTQDSIHMLKTFCSNLFTGARMPTFGNFTAIFRRIYEIAMDPKSLMYKRDVEQLDRQDDRTMTRLFCAIVLEYWSENHPEYVGEIVYLFVFGELVDTYQNCKIGHAERIKRALRARYFLDGSGKTILHGTKRLLDLRLEIWRSSVPCVWLWNSRQLGRPFDGGICQS
ncbi:hypothetical protein B0H13DRAFT_1614840 [Mycena leptocephala]|nr:hypothetical protein B0H13DRAFT_1614840 [Mycena leptocephala]